MRVAYDPLLACWREAEKHPTGARFDSEILNNAAACLCALAP